MHHYNILFINVYVVIILLETIIVRNFNTIWNAIIIHINFFKIDFVIY